MHQWIKLWFHCSKVQAPLKWAPDELKSKTYAVSFFTSTFLRSLWTTVQRWHVTGGIGHSHRSILKNMFLRIGADAWWQRSILTPPGALLSNGTLQQNLLQKNFCLHRDQYWRNFARADAWWQRSITATPGVLCTKQWHFVSVKRYTLLLGVNSFQQKHWAFSIVLLMYKLNLSIKNY